MARYTSTRKAQTSTVDFIIGLTMIIIAIVLSVSVISSLQQPSNFSSVLRQANLASEQLMSEGYPKNWTQDQVLRVGLLTNNRLNETKIQEAYDMDYPDIRQRLVGHYNFFVYFENTTNIIFFEGRCGFGYPDLSYAASCHQIVSSHNNLVSVERLLVYNDEVIKMVVLVWD